MKKWFSLITRFIIGILFFVSGFSKLLNITDFLISLAKFTTIPGFLISYIAHILPILEAILGILLIGGILLKWTTRGIFILMLIFTIIVFLEYINGNIINCNCFVKLINITINIYSLNRNVILLTISFILMKNYTSILSFDDLLIYFKTKKNENQRPNYIEILSGIAVLLLTTFCISLIVIHLLTLQYPANVITQNSIIDTQNQFIALESVRKILLEIEPAVDSITVLSINSNLTIYERYSKSQYKDRFLEIKKYFKCISCNNIHIILKLSFNFTIDNIIILNKNYNSNKLNFINQFISKNFYHLFDSSFPIKIINGEEEWCYYVILGLREAAIEVKESYFSNKIEEESL